MRRLSPRAKAALTTQHRRREVILPKPLPHQLELLRDTHRHKRAACGRRFGKTGAGLIMAVAGHGHPDPSHPEHLKGALDGGNIIWGAPTFVIAMKIERDVMKAFAHSGFNYSKSEKRIEVCRGGSVTIKTAASPESFRGDGYDGVIFDEAAFIEEPVWTEAARPALSDKQGWSAMLSTPDGFNWFKRQCDMHLTDPSFRTWQLPSSLNPLMTPEELESARLDIGDRSFSQEYLAQFVDVEGAEFPGSFWSRPDFWYDDPIPDSDVKLRVLALDPSKGKTDKSDYSAFVRLTLHRNGHMYVEADLERCDVTKIAAKTVDMIQSFNPHGVVIEINQFQELLSTHICQLLTSKGITPDGLMFPKNNTANKLARIRSTLTPYLSRGEIHFRRSCRGARLLVEQLQEFPTGKHDDGPDALEMGICLLRHIFDGGMY